MRRILIGTIPGLIIASILYAIVPGDSHPMAPLMAAVMGLMAAWWVQDVVPIPVTSLLPIFLFPLLEIIPTADTSVYYGRPIIFLFLGGFLLALGLQESGVHRRIALNTIRIIGTNPQKLVLGFMVVTGFLSMWISNTASTMVMLPIALSVIPNIQGDDALTDLKSFGLCLMLGIAYSANIGGMATLIGTPPNLIFLEIFHQLFPDTPEVGFTDWMIVGLPISILFIGVGWYVLTRYIFRIPGSEGKSADTSISEQIAGLGAMRHDEKYTLIIFGLAALLWMTGSDISIGSTTIHGWRSWTGLTMVSDPAVAVFAAILLFVVPSTEKDKKSLLSWSATKELPWGILLLFGGGFALAGGFESSGLSNMLQETFANIPKWSPLVIMALVCVVVTFQTEITSNSAVTTLILPILASGSVALGIDPKLLMIPATLCASCAFMMPIATPPQAIIYGSGYVSVKQMMRAGIWFNLLGLAITISVVSLIHQWVW